MKMEWYLLQTKPSQEERASQNLQAQGYTIYFPQVSVEKVRHGQISYKKEPLFARYLFIQLDQVLSNWGPIRSTRVISGFVRFGPNEPRNIDQDLIQDLQTRLSEAPVLKSLFEKNQQLDVLSGPFVGLSGFYQEMITLQSGEQRALLLIDLLGKVQKIQLPLSSLKSNS